VPWQNGQPVPDLAVAWAAFGETFWQLGELGFCRSRRPERPRLEDNTCLCLHELVMCAERLLYSWTFRAERNLPFQPNHQRVDQHDYIQARNLPCSN